jgi:DNA adenine methylase
MKPLFIWAGGKNKMIKNYLQEISQLGKIDTMVEPFFGGGAMTIYMYENYPNIDKFIINDIKPEIIGIYKAIKEDYETFVNELRRYDSEYIPLDKSGRSEYYYLRRTQHAFEYENMTNTQVSALLYFLMRTSFNGIWQINQNTAGRYGTPAGLLNQKVSCFEWGNICEWNEFLQKAELFSEDWKSVSQRYTNTSSFFFFDPPYRDSFTQYGGEFNDDHQKELIEFCNELPKNCKVFLTNRDEGEGFFDELVNGEKLNIKRIPVTYTAGRRKKTDDGFEAKPATEVLIHTR